MPFKPGDVVVLKSGGERMTVAAITANGEYDCMWQEKKAGSTVDRRATYPEVVLTSGARGAVVMSRRTT